MFLNSYLEKNSQSLMRQVNQNLRETSMKDYNQLKVGLLPRAEGADLAAVAHSGDRRRADLLHRPQSVLFSSFIHAQRGQNALVYRLRRHVRRRRHQHPRDLVPHRRRHRHPCRSPRFSRLTRRRAAPRRGREGVRIRRHWRIHAPRSEPSCTSHSKGMYLVAKEVLNDVLRMNILPAIFQRYPILHDDVDLPADLLDKVSPFPRLDDRSRRPRGS